MSLNKKKHQPPSPTSSHKHRTILGLRSSDSIGKNRCCPCPSTSRFPPSKKRSRLCKCSTLWACSESTSTKLGLLHLSHHPLPTEDFIAPVITSNSHHQSSPVSVAFLHLGFNLQTDKHIWSILDRLKTILGPRRRFPGKLSRQSCFDKSS